jgi:hypothetical protein
MDINVPYMPSVKNLHAILDKVQHAAVPEAFGIDFLKDLGVTSSNDRSIIKVFKYLGFLDASGRPQTPYREFVDHNKTKYVLADRLRAAFDDLYIANKKAHEMSVDALKGWFKSKTGKGDAVALKMASTFKSLASYADFSQAPKPIEKKEGIQKEDIDIHKQKRGTLNIEEIGLVYRFEIHLPDTQNIDTFRAIFKAIREELMQ